jgi:hypothetical protein
VREKRAVFEVNLPNGLGVLEHAAPRAPSPFISWRISVTGADGDPQGDTLGIQLALSTHSAFPVNLTPEGRSPRNNFLGAGMGMGIEDMWTCKRVRP